MINNWQKVYNRGRMRFIEEENLDETTDKYNNERGEYLGNIIGNIGDVGVGKTCMIIRATENRYPDEYIPPYWGDNTLLSYNFGEKKSVVISFQELVLLNNSNIVNLFFRQPYSVYYLCFSISDRKSFTNLISFWEPLLFERQPTIPILLIGTKQALRVQGDRRFVSRAEGERMARILGAQAYYECDAKTDREWKDFYGVFPFLEHAAKLVLHKPKEKKDKNKKEKCSIFE